MRNIFTKALIFALGCGVVHAQTQLDVSRQTKNFGPDLSITPGSVQVIGIRGNSVPTLSSGYLHYNGSAWVFDTPAGGFTLTTTGSSGPATFSSGVLNIPQYSGGGGTNPTVNGIQKWNGSAWLLAVLGTDYYGPDATKNGAFSFQAGSGGDGTCPTPAVGLDATCWFSSLNQNMRSQNGGAYAAIPAYDPTTGVLTSPTGTGPDGISFAEGSTPFNCVTNVGSFYSYTDHKPHYCANAGSDTTIITSSSYINAAGQPTQTNLAAALPVNQGGTGTTVSFSAVQVTLPTSSIAASPFCTTVTTVSMTGIDTTKFPTFDATPATDPSAVNGWGGVGGLNFVVYPTTNNMNWKVCNVTPAAILPGALTLNVKPRQNP